MEKGPKLVEKIDSLIVKIDSPEKYKAVSEAGLGMDYRAKEEEGNGVASVFEGLDFDSENLRTQSYLLEKESEVVAVITFAIAPKKWIEGQRYFRKVEGGVEVCDFKMVAGDLPEFLIIPAWTKVIPKYRGKFAWSGFKLFDNVLKTIQEESLENTWIEVVAMGTDNHQEETRGLSRNTPVGTFLREDQLPFSLDKIGVSAESASSTGKMATLLKIPLIPNIGSAGTLGPVYAKSIK